MAVSAPDDSVVQVPDVVANLDRALQINQQGYRLLDAYFRGSHPHTFDSTRFRAAFGRQLRDFADNWMRLVVNATVNRLTVQGFRIGSADFGMADRDAWAIWKASRLSQASTMAHREALKFGTCFLLVDPTVAGRPRITVESPMQVVGQRSSEDRYTLINAIKKWVGDDGLMYLNFYEPDQVIKYRSRARAQSSVPNDPERVTQSAAFEIIDQVDNPLGVVPIVAIENNPDLLIGGVSDLDDLIPLNDALNKELRDMMVASEYQAFRQRWITGVDVPKDPRTGKPMTQSMAQLTASERNVWMFPPTARGQDPIMIGEFNQIDLSPFISAIDMLIHHISMVSNTPAYMLVGRMANMSADAIRAAELGFVGKLLTKQADFGVGWERAIGMALGTTDDIETIWASAAANSGSILSNELSQMVALGMPRRIAYEKYGETPQAVEYWERLNQEELDRAAAFAAANPAAAAMLAASTSRAAAAVIPPTTPAPGDPVEPDA